ncbi:MAG TPA: choice-of-anchor Q domain-containing protein [Acidimicrobiales bacterium]|nr:choice-of-anchor Q domain-containing protein [Acidimicrobiales bacterium]
MGSRRRARQQGTAARRVGRAVAAASLGVGLGIAAMPLATAGAAATVRAPRAVAPAAPRPHGAAQPRQHLVVAPGAVTTGHLPRLARPHGVATKVFTVTTAGDSPLATPTTTTCTDQATHACSLRAAIGAANNLAVPVLIKLGPHTYQESDLVDGTMVVTNPAGTTIEGASTHATILAATGGFAAVLLTVSENVHDTGSSLTLENLTLSGGDGTDGGAIAESDDNVGLVLDGVDLTHNTATYGGGLYCDDASLWVTNSVISSNTATKDGGGVYLYWCSSYFTAATINSNSATSPSSTADGGGAYAGYGTTRYVNSSISHNSAGAATESGNGGGVFTYYSDDVLVGTHVDHNTAIDDGDGGGYYLDYSVLDATASTFNADRAPGSGAAGGGIELYGGEAELHHSQLEHDSTGSTSSTDAGGGVYLYGYEEPATLHVDAHSTIADNKTGAIVSYQYYAGTDVSIADSVVQGNTSSLEGAGGIYAYSYYGGGSLELTNDQFLGNADGSTESAGAVFAYVEYGGETVTVTGGTFKGNVGSAKESMGAIGAWTYYGAATFNVTGTKVLDNRAPVEGWGGGIGAYDEGDSNVQLNLTGDTIEGNVSGSSNATDAGEGGGVWLDDYGYLDLTDCTVSHNEALGGGASSGDGGGVYDASYLGGTYRGDTISGNRATGPASEGGGMWVYPYYGGGKLVQSTIAGNMAEQGAGLWVYYYQFEVVQSTVTGNVAGSPGAQGLGGGIFGYETRVDVVNSTITGNRAVTGGGKAGEGGGLYGYDSSFALYYATVDGNVAPAGAGEYTTDSASGTTRDSIISQNHPSAASKAEADCKGSAHVDLLVSLGGNVVGQGGCVATRTASDVVSAKPGLLALAANGGPTETMALTASSPAVNAAHGDCLATDQRGMPRPSTGRCDAGAYQLVGKAAAH